MYKFVKILIGVHKPHVNLNLKINEQILVNVSS